MMITFALSFSLSLSSFYVISCRFSFCCFRPEKKKKKKGWLFILFVGGFYILAAIMWYLRLCILCYVLFPNSRTAYTIVAWWSTTTTTNYGTLPLLKYLCSKKQPYIFASLKQKCSIEKFSNFRIFVVNYFSLCAWTLNILNILNIEVEFCNKECACVVFM